MTCDRYRPQLALLVGNDLDPREVGNVRGHLGACPACQAYWDSLQTSHTALQDVSCRTARPVPESLWGRIARQLGDRPVPRVDEAPGWLTLGAFTAACAALLWLTVSTPVFDFDFREVQVTDLGPVPAAPVSPFASQYPSLQLVNDARAVIPLQVNLEGTTEAVTPPRSLFGERRSL